MQQELEVKKRDLKIIEKIQRAKLKEESIVEKVETVLIAPTITTTMTAITTSTTTTKVEALPVIVSKSEA